MDATAAALWAVLGSLALVLGGLVWVKRAAIFER